MNTNCLYQAILNGDEKQTRYLMETAITYHADIEELFCTKITPAIHEQIKRFVEGETGILTVLKSAKCLSLCLTITQFISSKNKLLVSIQERVVIDQTSKPNIPASERLYCQFDPEAFTVTDFYMNCPVYKLPKVIDALAEIYLVSANSAASTALDSDETYLLKNQYGLDIIVDGLSLTPYYRSLYQIESVTQISNSDSTKCEFRRTAATAQDTAVHYQFPVADYNNSAGVGLTA